MVLIIVDTHPSDARVVGPEDALLLLYEPAMYNAG